MMDFQNNLVRNVAKKKFDFALVEKLYLLDVYIDGKRYYNVPNPDYVPEKNNILLYKSVTTIIDEKSDKSWYPEWVERVGQEEADAVTNISARRGQSIHNMAEHYIRGEDYWKEQGTINVMDFNKLVPILNNHVDHIYGQELPLYSHKLKTAGRTDLACWWDQYPAIVDFKTARRDKLEEQIDAYMIQAACYAKMFQERYAIHMDKIVILLLVDHEDEPRVFEDNVYPHWNDKVKEYFIGE